MKFKKILVILGVVLVSTSLTACGEKTSNTTKKESVAKKEEKKENLIALGETIKSKTKEITLNKVEFSKDVMPSAPSEFYMHYEAEDGKTYIDVGVDVKNLKKTDLECDKVMTVTADYNKGYTYKSFDTVEENGDFTYSNITTISPLDTKKMNYLVEVPEAVETGKEPLFLVIKIDGDSYKYTIR